MENIISMESDSCSSFVQVCPTKNVQFLVLCCDVRYSFRIATMFGSSLPPAFCRMAHVLQCFLCMLTYSNVQYFAVAHLFSLMCCALFCFVVFCFSCFLCDQCCQFLWITPSVCSNVNIMRVLNFVYFHLELKETDISQSDHSSNTDTVGV